MNQILRILKPGGILHFEIPNHFSLSSSIRKISPILSYDYGFIQPPMHMRAYSSYTIKKLFKKNQLIIKDIFTCSNNDLTWGQVRKYSFFQKLFFTYLALFGKGSLLIGIAKKIMNKLLKRLLDLFFGLIIIFIITPVIIIICLVSVITHGFPIFFIHERLGLNGKPFNMIKFRSMLVGPSC